MYVRTTTRKNKDGSVVRYLQLAESVWDAEHQRSKTRVIHNLGREDELDPEAMRRLAQSVLRVAAPEELERRRAEGGGGAPLRLEWAKDYGGLYVLRALAEAAFLVVANRALAPESKLGLYARWLEGVYWPAAEAVELHHLYVALEVLAEGKARLERDIFFRVAGFLSTDVDLVFYDTTRVYFETEEEDGAEGLRK